MHQHPHLIWRMHQRPPFFRLRMENIVEQVKHIRRTLVRPINEMTTLVHRHEKKT